MTCADMALAVACMATILCSAYAQPPAECALDFQFWGGPSSSLLDSFGAVSLGEITPGDADLNTAGFCKLDKGEGMQHLILIFRPSSRVSPFCCNRKQAVSANHS